MALEAVPVFGKGVGAKALVAFAEGDVVLESAPLAAVVSAEQLTGRCSHCFRSPASAGPIPLSGAEGKEVVALKRCGGCRGPYYCSKACQKKDWTEFHREECAVFKIASMRPVDEGSDDSALANVPDEARLMLRVLIRCIQDPELVTDVSELADHYASSSEEQRLKYAQRSMYVGQMMSEHVRRALPSILPSPTTLLRLWSVLETNAFAVLDPMDLVACGAALHTRLLPRINHSCDPNATVVHISEGGGVRVVAMKDIAANEEITVSYLDVMRTRKERQKELSGRYKFECVCIECQRSGMADHVDLREAWRCLSCIEAGSLGGMPPPKATKASDKVQIECASCGSVDVLSITKDVYVVNGLISKAQELLHKASGFSLAYAYDDSLPPEEDHVSDDSIPQPMAVEKQLARYLHPVHHVLLQLRQHLFHQCLDRNDLAAALAMAREIEVAHAVVLPRLHPVALVHSYAAVKLRMAVMSENDTAAVEELDRDLGSLERRIGAVWGVGSRLYREVASKQEETAQQAAYLRRA